MQVVLAKTEQKNKKGYKNKNKTGFGKIFGQEIRKIIFRSKIA